MYVTDHKGNKFASQGEMCEFYDIPHDVFKSRIRAGWALKDALETPVTVNLGRFQVRDHRGNMFKSIEEMCKAYDITYVTFSHRLKLGWTLKDALETPVRVHLEAYWVTDHKGNKFKSKKEMCKAYGINYSTFKSRMRLGWALKDALEGKYVTDHKGNKFESIKEMCEAYGVDYCTFRTRVGRGWVLKEALKTPIDAALDKWQVIDHKGNKFKSKKEMCEAYGINYGTFKSRMRLGWTLKDALETPAKEV